MGQKGTQGDYDLAEKGHKPVLPSNDERTCQE